jgi:hypothetical protein
MENEMRKMIDQVKNFGKSLNENTNSTFLVKEGDYLAIANGFLYCDDPHNKKGFTFKGKIFAPNWITVYEMGNYGGVDCFRVKVHHNTGVDYEGADKIVPISEFQKQGVRPTEYSKDIDWYVWQGKKPDKFPEMP